MLSIKPRQRAGEKGVMFKLVKSSSSEARLNNLKFLTNLYTCNSVGDSFVAVKYLYAGYNNSLKSTTDIF